MKYLKTLLITIISIIIAVIFLSSMYYYNIISKSVFQISEIIMIMLLFLKNGFSIEKKSNRKYFINIVISILLCVMILLTNIINQSITYRLLIYVLIIVLSNLLGGFVFRKKKNHLISK